MKMKNEVAARHRSTKALVKQLHQCENEVEAEVIKWLRERGWVAIRQQSAVAVGPTGRRIRIGRRKWRRGAVRRCGFC